MKRIINVLLVAFVLSLVPVTHVCAQELVMECSYNTIAQNLKCLIVVSKEKSECMVKTGSMSCHYDIEVNMMGKNVIFYATNPSISSWVNVLYIMGENDRNIIFVPSYPSGNNSFPLTYTTIDEQNYAKKKREYGIGQRSSKNSEK